MLRKTGLTNSKDRGQFDPQINADEPDADGTNSNTSGEGCAARSGDLRRTEVRHSEEFAPIFCVNLRASADTLLADLHSSVVDYLNEAIYQPTSA